MFDKSSAMWNYVKPLNITWLQHHFTSLLLKGHLQKECNLTIYKSHFFSQDWVDTETEYWICTWCDNMLECKSDLWACTRQSLKDIIVLLSRSAEQMPLFIPSFPTLLV